VTESSPCDLCTLSHDHIVALKPTGHGCPRTHARAHTHTHTHTHTLNRSSSRGISTIYGACWVASDVGDRTRYTCCCCCCCPAACRTTTTTTTTTGISGGLAALTSPTGPPPPAPLNYFDEHHDGVAAAHHKDLGGGSRSVVFGFLRRLSAARFLVGRTREPSCSHAPRTRFKPTHRQHFSPHGRARRYTRHCCCGRRASHSDLSSCLSLSLSVCLSLSLSTTLQGSPLHQSGVNQEAIYECASYRSAQNKIAILPFLQSSKNERIHSMMEKRSQEVSVSAKTKQPQS